MLLLPVSHEDGTVRRLPLVSVAVIVTCVGFQVHSCAVMPGLEARGEALQRERAQVQQAAIEAHLQTLSPKEHQENEQRRIDALAEGGSERDLHLALLAMQQEAPQKFRAGELTAPDDPNYVRYLEIGEELKRLEARVPVIRFGYRPALDGIMSLVSSMFAHGGWLHLVGNMWFLYLVACNLEDRWGRWQFLSFYLCAGAIAALSFGGLHPDMREPLVGASGAVAGAMGAFMVCFARTRVKMFYMYWLLLTPRWGTFRASAWVVLALWVGEQFLMTFVEISSSTTQIAYSAHAGGFLFGATVAFLLTQSGVDSQLDAASEQAAEAGSELWQEHPLYLRAMELRDAGDDATATERLVQLLSENPAHIGAREALFDLGVTRGDLRAVDLGLPFLVDYYQRTQAHAEQLRTFRELRQAFPNYGLTDQELVRVAAAAQKQQDATLAIRCVAELLEQYPDSPLAPRALWVAAEVQGRIGARDQQQHTLDRIVLRFPEHACARLARDQLLRMGAPA